VFDEVVDGPELREVMKKYDNVILEINEQEEESDEDEPEIGEEEYAEMFGDDST
jgi:hypothetical protein